MAKYKVKNTTILHNGKAYGDGAVIELSDADADKLTKYLEDELISLEKEIKDYRTSLQPLRHCEERSDEAISEYVRHSTRLPQSSAEG